MRIFGYFSNWIHLLRPSTYRYGPLNRWLKRESTIERERRAWMTTYRLVVIHDKMQDADRMFLPKNLNVELAIRRKILCTNAQNADHLWVGVQCYSWILMVPIHSCALCDSSGQFCRTTSIGFILIRTISVNDIVIIKTKMPMTYIVCLHVADIHKN